VFVLAAVGLTRRRRRRAPVFDGSDEPDFDSAAAARIGTLDPADPGPVDDEFTPDNTVAPVASVVADDLDAPTDDTAPDPAVGPEPVARADASDPSEVMAPVEPVVAEPIVAVAAASDQPWLVRDPEPMSEADDTDEADEVDDEPEPRPRSGGQSPEDALAALDAQVEALIARADRLGQPSVDEPPAASSPDEPGPGEP